MQYNNPYAPYMGKKDDRFPDDLHGDLPYADDPIYDPFAPDSFRNEKREAYGDDLPTVGDPIDNPADNPPVPNRAWTEMKNGMDIDDLTEEEKRDMYYGSDSLF